MNSDPNQSSSMIVQQHEAIIAAWVQVASVTPPQGQYLLSKQEIRAAGIDEDGVEPLVCHLISRFPGTWIMDRTRDGQTYIFERLA